MSNADGSIPNTMSRKKKRGFGFRYSTKKALERSKLSKDKAKDRGFEIGSVRKTLSYPSELSNEIGVVDLAECCTRSFNQLSLHSVDERQVVRTDVGLENVDSTVECCEIVSIIASILKHHMLTSLHRVTIMICIVV